MMGLLCLLQDAKWNIGIAFHQTNTLNWGTHAYIVRYYEIHVYIYIYIIHIHVWVYVCACQHNSTHTHVYIYTCVSVYEHFWINIYIYLYHTYMQKNDSYANTFPCQMDMHVCIQIRMEGCACFFNCLHFIIQLWRCFFSRIPSCYVEYDCLSSCDDMSNIQLLSLFSCVPTMWCPLVADWFINQYHIYVYDCICLWYLCRDHSIHPSYLLSKHN